MVLPHTFFKGVAPSNERGADNTVPKRDLFFKI